MSPSSAIITNNALEDWNFAEYLDRIKLVKASILKVGTAWRGRKRNLPINYSSPSSKLIHHSSGINHIHHTLQISIAINYGLWAPYKRLIPAKWDIIRAKYGIS